MAAVKPFFYKLDDSVKGVCVSVDINSYVGELKVRFGKAALGNVDATAELPGGPLFYTDTPRNVHARPRKYQLEDAISDCLRSNDKEGKAKEALAKKIAKKAVSNRKFREKLLAYNRVPQSWRDMLFPGETADEDIAPDKDKIHEALLNLADRDYRTPTGARGHRHPLARIMESQHFSRNEKLKFVADYFIGKKHKKAAPVAVRIGTEHDYREFNITRWLKQNRAYRLETVGDIVSLTAHFTKTNRLQRGATPDLPQLSPGDLKPAKQDKPSVK